MAPSAMNFLYCADSSYIEAEITQAEKYILKTFEWNMNCSNPIHFLRWVSKANEYNVHPRYCYQVLLGDGVCGVETHRCSTISVGCGVDVVGSLRAREEGGYVK